MAASIVNVLCVLFLFAQFETRVPDIRLPNAALVVKKRRGHFGDDRFSSSCEPWQAWTEVRYQQKLVELHGSRTPAVLDTSFAGLRIAGDLESPPVVERFAKQNTRLGAGRGGTCQKHEQQVQRCSVMPPHVDLLLCWVYLRLCSRGPIRSRAVTAAPVNGGT